MWDTYQLPALGNFSLSKIARTFFAVLLSAFLLAILNSSVTHAADATWQDDGSIIYNGKTYRPESPAPAGVEVPAGASVFVSKQEAQGTASVLYIEQNADTTKEMRVKVAEYTLTQTGELTNPRPPTDISLAAKPPAKNKTQCDVAGVGWIICVTSRFIAEGMDKIFALIASYLEVKPVSTDTESGLYKAWAVALSIANLMFILAFLIIIYSQITSVGLNNYNIKKMVPKLIIAAVLVNVSYYVCAIAVDISNILGHSVQQALIDIRRSLPDPTAGSMDSFSWKNITEYILSGGTIVAGAFAAKAAFLGGAAGGSISGLTFLLFPILVAGALAVLIALLVLAARQALITVLIVVAPLAFVAYLLPNTEKWFEKWRDLFMTMLLVFPLFSLLFGGSQLASYIIIQNADQISIIIFAMFIQVAPLVMTPFLVKFSGSLLGRLAGMVNDPKRGVVDRARGWATDKAEVQKAKGQEAAARPGGRGGTRFQRQAFKREKDRMNREAWKKRGESHADAAWHNDSRYMAHHESLGAAELRQKSGESRANSHFEQRKATDRNLQRYVGTQRINDDIIKTLQTKEEAAWEEAKSKDVAQSNRFIKYAADAQSTYQEQRIAQDNTSIAQSLQKKEYAENVSKDVALQIRAGGIGGEQGAIKVKAAAMSEVVEAGVTAVKAIKTASDIKPGDVKAMRVAFDNAVLENDTASMRAHADMMAESSNAGVDELRTAIRKNEDKIRLNPELDTFRHHINSNATINAAAEDVAVWSRDSHKGFRRLEEISTSGDTWKNLTANAIASMKYSSQQLALNATVTHDDGSWSYALSPKMAKDIRNSPSTWAGIKEEMKPQFEARINESDNHLPIR